MKWEDFINKCFDLLELLIVVGAVVLMVYIVVRC